MGGNEGASFKKSFRYEIWTVFVIFIVSSCCFIVSSGMGQSSDDPMQGIGDESWIKIYKTPPIDDFTVNPEHIQSGKSVELSWNISSHEDYEQVLYKIEVKQINVSPIGRTTDSPKCNTTYILTNLPRGIGNIGSGSVARVSVWVDSSNGS